MRLAQILTTLQEEPMMIVPSWHASLLQLFREHASLSAAEFQAKREGVDWCGEAVDLEQAELIDGIMMIPINGPLGFKLGEFEKGAGAVDYLDIMKEVASANADPHCGGILLNFDSPGGMVHGCEETANAIAASDKPVYAYASGMMCSAAYWLASAAEQIIGTTSADVGSIGVYCYLLDQSKRYEAAGYKAEVIASGKYKGAGAPGVPLTKDQRAMMQERINVLAEGFYEQVEDTRLGVERDDMQGQVFTARQALAKGFLDDVMDSADDAADELRAFAGIR